MYHMCKTADVTRAMSWKLDIVVRSSESYTEIFINFPYLGTLRRCIATFVVVWFSICMSDIQLSVQSALLCL